MKSAVAWCVFGVCAATLVAEGILRWCPVATGYAYQALNADHPILQGTPGFSYTYSRGWNLRLVSRGLLNNEGFIADRDYKVDGGGVLVVGDSYVQAAALPPGANLHAELARRLRPTQVCGLSRAGGSLPDYLALVKWGIERYKSDTVVILAVTGDVDESVNPKSGGYYFKLGNALNGNASAYEQTRVDRGSFSAWQKMVNRSMLFRYVYDNLAFTVNFPMRTARADMDMQRDFARRQKYVEISEYFLSSLSALVDPSRVIIMVSRVRREGSLIYETDVDVLRDAATKRGFHVIDVGAVFKVYEDEHGDRLDFSPTDVHWNAAAQQVAADQLLPLIRQMGAGTGKVQ